MDGKPNHHLAKWKWWTDFLWIDFWWILSGYLCPEAHPENHCSSPPPKRKKKKIQGVPRVYSNGKADEVDRKSSHIQRSSTVYWEPYVHHLRSPFTSAQLGILSFMCREIHPRCLTLEPRSVPWRHATSLLVRVFPSSGQRQGKAADEQPQQGARPRGVHGTWGAHQNCRLSGPLEIRMLLLLAAHNSRGVTQLPNAGDGVPGCNVPRFFPSSIFAHALRLT